MLNVQSEGFEMTKEVLGIICVFVVTGVLLALRHLIVSVGKRGRILSAANDPKPATTVLRAVRPNEQRGIEIDEELESETPRKKRAVEQIDPRWYPRFPM
jgi:hypothetical protein